MSAIGGLWNRNGAPASLTEFAAMTDALKHYGPDGLDTWLHASAAMVHRRMVLSAEDESARQPVSFADGRLHLVADLRLDNRDELAKAIGLDSGEAAGVSDADMLARSYNRWGEDCLQRLLGDYSFAIWDKVNQNWFLARDPVGTLPLYYFAVPRCLRLRPCPLVCWS